MPVPCLTSVPCLHHACTMPAPCLHHACTMPGTMPAPCLHHACTMPAPCLHHACTMPGTMPAPCLDYHFGSFAAVFVGGKIGSLEGSWSSQKDEVRGRVVALGEDCEKVYVWHTKTQTFGKHEKYGEDLEVR